MGLPLLTMIELTNVVNAIPVSELDPDVQIQIQADDERVCVKDLKGKVLSWIKRDKRKRKILSG